MNTWWTYKYNFPFYLQKVIVLRPMDNEAQKALVTINETAPFCLHSGKQLHLYFPSRSELWIIAGLDGKSLINFKSNHTMVCGPLLGTFNSMDNFGHWIGSKIVSSCLQLWWVMQIVTSSFIRIGVTSWKLKEVKVKIILFYSWSHRTFLFWCSGLNLEWLLLMLSK